MEDEKVEKLDLSYLEKNRGVSRKLNEFQKAGIDDTMKDKDRLGAVVEYTKKEVMAREEKKVSKEVAKALEKDKRKRARTRKKATAKRRLENLAVSRTEKDILRNYLEEAIGNPLLEEVNIKERQYIECVVWTSLSEPDAVKLVFGLSGVEGKKKVKQLYDNLGVKRALEIENMKREIGMKSLYLRDAWEARKQTINLMRGAESEKVRLEASKDIQDRAGFKPKTEVDITAKTESPISKLDNKELDRRLKMKLKEAKEKEERKIIEGMKKVSEEAVVVG